MRKSTRALCQKRVWRKQNESWTRIHNNGSHRSRRSGSGSNSSRTSTPGRVSKGWDRRGSGVNKEVLTCFDCIQTMPSSCASCATPSSVSFARRRRSTTSGRWEVSRGRERLIGLKTLTPETRTCRKSSTLGKKGSVKQKFSYYEKLRNRNCLLILGFQFRFREGTTRVERSSWFE